MQIRRVTTDNGLHQTNTLNDSNKYQRERTLTTKRMADDKTSSNDSDFLPVFGKRSKKTLVDIELDADSDLDEFDETINDVVRENVGADYDNDNSTTVLQRKVTRKDDKPSSLEDKTVLDNLDEESGGTFVQRGSMIHRGITLESEVERVTRPAGSMVSAHDDNIDKILKMSLAKSILINNEPIRDEY